MDDVFVTHPGRSITVVELHGEHDLATKDELAAVLDREVEQNDLVIVDVSEADFVDCSCIHNLIRADQHARARGSRFVLQMGTARIVRTALSLSGVLDELTVSDDRTAALTM